VREVHAGRSFVSPALVNVLNQQVQSANELTPQEELVLRYVVRGRTSKEIASEMEISPKTVAKHRENVSRKLNLHSPAEWIQYAIKQGMVDPAFNDFSPKADSD
jgi:DNA-binding NarL/FixJ family response regulator